jgi:hypothetical protein
MLVNRSRIPTRKLEGRLFDQRYRIVDRRWAALPSRQHHTEYTSNVHTVEVRRYAVPTQGLMSARLKTRPRVGKAVVILFISTSLGNDERDVHGLINQTTE